MNKEEIKRYREEQDRKETAKIMKAINEQNKRRRQERLLQEQIDKINKEKAQKKEVVINFALVVVVILTLFTMLIAMLSFSMKSNEGTLDQCVKTGFNQTYCERQMGL